MFFKDKLPERPSNYAYFSWYVLLFSWVQNIVICHVALAICALMAIYHFPQAILKLKSIPGVWIPVLCYEVIRLVSAAISAHPSAAFIGLFDDLRAIVFGLLVLVFLQKKTDLQNAAWISLAGFVFFACSKLLYHLFFQALSLQPTIQIKLGMLGSVNNAAAITSIVMLSALAASILLPYKSSRWIILGLIPLVILQAPLGSRTTILVTILLLSLLIVFFRAWKASIVILFLALIIGVGLFYTPTGISQFASLEQSKEQLKGHATMPSIQIRWEIFQTIWHLSLQHVLGLGPRNNNYVDLNAERDFLKEHARTICKDVYGFDTNSKQFVTFDFNHPQGIGSYPFTHDPHSQYTSVISETGPVGLILLFLIYAGLFRYTIPLLQVTNPIDQRILGISGVLMLLVFLLSGITVVLIYQAGNMILFGYIAALSCCQKTIRTNAHDTRLPLV